MDKLTEAINWIQVLQGPKDKRLEPDQSKMQTVIDAARTLQKIVEAMPKNPYMDQRAFESAVYSSTMKILRDGGYIE